MSTATFSIWRGEYGAGRFEDYPTDVSEGMVVLDAVHQIQSDQANDLACRWNCKAGKCGSCSAEINGKPRLMCMTRLNELNLEKPVTIEPMRAFPHVRDLVTYVSWNFRVKKKIQQFTPVAPDADGQWRMQQGDVDRVQEFRKCIECFLCQDVCHVLRDHQLHDQFVGPRFLVHIAALEMHPLYDTIDRTAELRGSRRHRVLQHHQVLYHGLPPRGSRSPTMRSFRSRRKVADRYYDPPESTRANWCEGTPMFELKRLTAAGIPAALEKAEQYRLLNQPWAAESICWDTYAAVDPTHQHALRTRLLAQTDQLGSDMGAVRRCAPKRLAVDSLMRTSVHIMPASSASVSRRRHWNIARLAPGTPPMTNCAKRWSGTTRPRPSGSAGDDDAILRWRLPARACSISRRTSPPRGDGLERARDPGE